MIWHDDLAAAVKSELQARNWGTLPPSTRFDATARSKTHDTLVQKLRRESRLTLDQVQDLAGVRIDADFLLDTQLALATEIAEHFGDKSVIRDIRAQPHSGYRAVHVWLRLPAGKVEVQIRTEAQSVWANTYERLGDLLGRGIRYGEMPEGPNSASLVGSLHRISEQIAAAEELEQRTVDLQSWLDGVLPHERDGKHDEMDTQLGVAGREVRQTKASYISELNKLKRMLDGMEDY
jgi:ppGpp synthetase/RelA/SpoT-type nucleotidyltranferase